MLKKEELEEESEEFLETIGAKLFRLSNDPSMVDAGGFRITIKEIARDIQDYLSFNREEK